MCWVAVDRGARLALLRGETELAATWQSSANEIHDDVCTHGVNASGQFTQFYGSDNLDVFFCFRCSDSFLRMMTDYVQLCWRLPAT